MKKYCLLFVAMMILLSSCGGSGKSGADSTGTTLPTATVPFTAAETTVPPTFAPTAYKIMTEKFVSDYIIIEYPRLEELPDRQNTVNLLLKERVLNTMSRYTDMARTVEVNITFSPSYKNDRFLSIIYKGSERFPDAKQAGNLFYTVNMDLKNGQKMILTDLISLDEALLQKITDAANVKAAGQTTFFVNGIRNSLSGADFYLTPGAIGISLFVSEELGNHMEVEIPYADLSGFTTNHAFWMQTGG